MMMLQQARCTEVTVKQEGGEPARALETLVLCGS